MFIITKVLWLVLEELVWHVFQLLLLYALLPLKIVDFYCACVFWHLVFIIIEFYLCDNLICYHFYLSWSCVATNGIITSTIRFVLVLYSSLILYLYHHLHSNTLSRLCVEFLTTCNNTRIGDTHAQHWLLLVDFKFTTCLLETYTNKLGCTWFCNYKWK